VNAIITRKQEHSRKPDEQYDIIRQCSPGPFLELFARKRREGWTSWGNQAETYEEERPVIRGYNNHVPCPEWPCSER
jgi:N6-adenosine-specific RNA methylase IME4